MREEHRKVYSSILRAEQVQLGVHGGALTSMVQPSPSVCTMVQCLRLMCAAAAGAIAIDAGPATRPRLVVVLPYRRVRSVEG